MEKAELYDKTVNAEYSHCDLSPIRSTTKFRYHPKVNVSSSSSSLPIHVSLLGKGSKEGLGDSSHAGLVWIEYFTHTIILLRGIAQVSSRHFPTA